MSNMLKVAEKEFIDLLSSRTVIVIFIGYLAIILIMLYNLKLGDYKPDNAGIALSDSLFSTIIAFGPILGVMIGCSSIANERHGNALNTLLVKPLYRDTIINGKILGSILFLAMVVCIAIAFYTSGMLIVYGNSLAPSFSDYVFNIPLVFIMSMILISVFLTVSLLISLLVKNQSFAMILGAIIVYISSVSTSSNFVHVLSRIFPSNADYIYDLIMGWSPQGLIDYTIFSTFRDPVSLIDSLAIIIPYSLRFLLYILISCVLCYIVFMRSDVS